MTGGIDPSELDPNVRPQDDLFLHVNGKWLSGCELPPDRASLSTFSDIAEEVQTSLGMIIDNACREPEDSDARKMGALFASFMDSEKLNGLGAQPVAAEMLLVNSVSSPQDFLHALGSLGRTGVPGFYRLLVDSDPHDPDHLTLFIEQGGLSLPSESYYRRCEFDGLRVAHLSHVQRMFQLVGTDNAAIRADGVIDIERSVAALHCDNVSARDKTLTSNRFAWTDILDMFNQGAHGTSADLACWAEALGLPRGGLETVILSQPSFTPGIANLLAVKSLQSWKDWLLWKVIQCRAPYLSDEFAEAHFDFYGRTLRGWSAVPGRRKRGITFVEQAMGGALGQKYVENHFPSGAKDGVADIMSNILKAYRSSFASLEWMSEGTREAAIRKLEGISFRIGYPESWTDYSQLEVNPDSLLENVRAVRHFEMTERFRRIGERTDRDAWRITPQTVSASYSRSTNDVTFPAAVLQDPFYDSGRDEAANYGAIGAGMAHEIGHAFDDQGSRFDCEGRFADWWEVNDRAEFEKISSGLSDQFHDLAPKQLPEHRTNGALCLGENIGDLGGLAMAWKAYQISLAGQEPPVLEGLTGSQRFFLSWARVWRFKGSDDEMIRLLSVGPHAPSEFRCNQVVRNMDAFYDAFSVREQDAMWMDPGDRISIW